MRVLSSSLVLFPKFQTQQQQEHREKEINIGKTMLNKGNLLYKASLLVGLFRQR